MGMRSCVFGMAVTVTVLMMGEASWALQAGGVEVGDLENGSVVGQRFKELLVDLDIHATEIGGLKVLYPPISVLDLKSRPGTPVLVRVTNRSTNERGFLMTAAANQTAPTVLNVQLVLKPGETKYIGIPISDLLYAAGATFVYRDHLNPKDAGGTLLLIK
ncbi:MAG: hypothetical protein E8D42_07545 [Nitrospira sp.]|nr:MAG: hypothetical protein E8D42_07545 [Nitrospira sp.]